VVDTLFVGYYSETSRLAAVRAATIVAVHRLPGDFRRDLEQEAKLEIWRKRSTYDARRGSWRTYSERVVANRMTSLVRRMYSTRSGQFREEPLHDRLGLPAASDNIELRISRAGVYRAIGRLRVAFAAAGFANPQGRP
jgi:DNA-directed RNA polymerase specialized sigma24 family protein